MLWRWAGDVIGIITIGIITITRLILFRSPPLPSRCALFFFIGHGRDLDVDLRSLHCG